MRKLIVPLLAVFLLLAGCDCVQARGPTTVDESTGLVCDNMGNSCDIMISGLGYDELAWEVEFSGVDISDNSFVASDSSRDLLILAVDSGVNEGCFEISFYPVLMNSTITGEAFSSDKMDTATAFLANIGEGINGENGGRQVLKCLIDSQFVNGYMICRTDNRDGTIKSAA
ncbi:hypothetical protein H6761_00165 [Candidatus Nomurabacteria bacterium]|nr:hypothetical protein [Candidatus Nomurabacteria bacterium]